MAQAVSIYNYHNLAHTNPNRSELQTIYEKAVTDDDSDENAYKPSGVSDGTYLASYYDTEKKARHIIYQDGDNGVHDFNITKNSRRHSHFHSILEPHSWAALLTYFTGEQIDNITDAIATTPLAVLYKADTYEVYLYYSILSGKDHKLRRIVRAKDGSWGSPTFPSKAPLMNAVTQLSVTQTSKGAHVFYLGTGGSKKGYQHYIDSWPKST